LETFRGQLRERDVEKENVINRRHSERLRRRRLDVQLLKYLKYLDPELVQSVEHHVTMAGKLQRLVGPNGVQAGRYRSA